MAFSPSVEKWRPLAELFIADAPTNYLLDWIRGESGGNRCNVTTSAGFPEIGLFQLDPGNARLGGIEQDALRVGCSGSSEIDDSPALQLLAMSSGVEYIKALKTLAHKRLQAVGTDWSETDPGFWAFVRYHFSAGSGAAQSALSRATTALGRAPTSWGEIVANGSPSQHWAEVSTANGLYALGWAPGGGTLSRGEWALMALAGILGVAAAMRFDQWLAKPV
jgi:hypothetical protein